MSRTLLRRAAGAALVTAVALASLLLVAPSASAHNVLLSTDPGDGATVGAVPSQVVLTFDKPALALGTAVTVVGPAGDAASGPPRLVDTTVSQPVRPGAPAGAYTVRWRVTSADGHPVSGSFTFTAATAAASAAPATTAPLPTGATSATPVATTERGPLSLYVIGGVVLLGIALTGVTLLLRRRDVQERGRGDG